eukprot:gene4242-5021_t
MDRVMVNSLKRSTLTLSLVLAASLALSACGRKGDLDPPSTPVDQQNKRGYRDGVLYAEGVAIPEIARTVGTPFYCYSTATLERHYKVFSKAFDGVDALVCYAMKANSNQAVLKTLGRLGAGVDVVSEGELRRAL